MHQLRVGGLYDPQSTSFPQRDSLRLTPNFCELVRFLSAPTAQEITAHETGAATFALIVESPDLLVLAYEYGDMDWCDSPFQVDRVSGGLAGVPGETDTGAIAFTTLVVDADSGVIRCLRVDEWSAPFAAHVRESIAEQLATPFDDLAAERRLNTLYQRYATSLDLVKARAVATCRVDEPSMGGSNDLTIGYF